MPNAFAYLMLLVAPVATLAFYRRFPPAIACAGFFVGALMFLPHDASFKIPGIPPLDKEILVVLALLVASRAWTRSRWRSMRLGAWARVLIAGMLASGVATVFLNRDPLNYGPLTLPGYVPYDAVSRVIMDLLIYIVPFMLGTALYRTSDDLRSMLVILALAGLAYSVPALWEARMSPHLHSDLYGYAQNNFGKNRRWGGYRPILFMQSGIATGVFMAATALAAAALSRVRQRVGPLSGRAAMIILTLMVIICKSTAAIIYTIITVPLFALAGPRALRAFLLIMMIITFAYPVVRMTVKGPTDEIVSFGMWLDPDRGRSIEYRFMNEDLAMEHVNKRLFFGWGTYARNRVYSDKGELESVFDAFWMTSLSQRGLIWSFCLFGLMALPVFSLLRRWPRIWNERDQVLALGMGYIMLVRLLDMMQNGFYTSLPMLIAGALFGALPELCRRPVAAHDAARRQAPVRPARSPIQV